MDTWTTIYCILWWGRAGGSCIFVFETVDKFWLMITYRIYWITTTLHIENTMNSGFNHVTTIWTCGLMTSITALYSSPIAYLWLALAALSLSSITYFVYFHHLLPTYLWAGIVGSCIFCSIQVRLYGRTQRIQYPAVDNRKQHDHSGATTRTLASTVRVSKCDSDWF